MAAPKKELDFYLHFAKPLVLNLTEPNDRVIAAAWIKKLKDPEAGCEKLRADYLKLLLFVLQRQRLVGPFSENPNNYDKLEEFPNHYKLQDVAKALIEAEVAERETKVAKGLAGPTGDYPPVTTEYSGNLLEYTAAQDIPNFGVHVFYAISKDPLPLWDNAEKGVFPKSAFSAIDVTSVAEVVSASASTPGLSSRSTSASRKRSRRISPDRDAPSPKRSPRGKTPPTTPLGVEPEPEERIPPSWGSNLIEVSEPPVSSRPSIPSSAASPRLPDGYEDIFEGTPPRYLDLDKEESPEQEMPARVAASGLRARDRSPLPAVQDYQRYVRDETLDDQIKALEKTGVEDLPQYDVEKMRKQLMQAKKKGTFKPPKGAAARAPVKGKASDKQMTKTKTVVKKSSSTTTATKAGSRQTITTSSKTSTEVVQKAVPAKKGAKPPAKAKGKPPPAKKAKPKTPPRKASPVAQIEVSPAYDMDELAKLGLRPEDLADVDVNVDDMDLDDFEVPEDYKYEELPEMKAEDEDEINQAFDEWEKRIAELEKEHAEDIAIYGDAVSPYRSPSPGPKPPSPRSAASLPYRTPSPRAPAGRRSASPPSAPSLPYRTPTPKKSPAYSPQLPEGEEDLYQGSPPGYYEPEEEPYVPHQYEVERVPQVPSRVEVSSYERIRYSPLPEFQMPEITITRAERTVSPQLPPEAHQKYDVEEMRRKILAAREKKAKKAAPKKGAAKKPAASASRGKVAKKEEVPKKVSKTTIKKVVQKTSSTKVTPSSSKVQQTQKTVVTKKQQMQPPGTAKKPAPKGAKAPPGKQIPGLKKVYEKRETKIEQYPDIGDLSAASLPYLTPPLPQRRTAPAAQPRTGIPRPGTGIPRAGTGIPRPGSGIPRPGTGIPRPGAARPASGIPKPGAAAGSKMPVSRITVQKKATVEERVDKYPDIAELSAASLPYLTPPQRYPDIAELSAASLPYLTPPLPKQPTPKKVEVSPAYDMDELAKLGLRPEDLADIDMNVDDMDLDDFEVPDDYKYEEFPDAKADDEDEIDEAFNEWERRIAELEREHADDIAKYGSPAVSPAPSLPYRTPSPRRQTPSPTGRRHETPPSLPYRTPPIKYPDMAELSAPSLPYQTPPLPAGREQNVEEELEQWEEQVAQMEQVMSPDPKTPAVGFEVPTTPSAPVKVPVKKIPASKMPGSKIKPPGKLRFPKPEPSKGAAKPSRLAVSAPQGPPAKRAAPSKRAPAAAPKAATPPRSPRIPIEPGTPAAQDIIDEANKQLETLDQLYERLQPGVAPERRTPPMFSKRKEIREAAAREGRQYAPEEFDVDEDQWVHGPDFFQDKLERSPYEPRRMPAKDVFPEVQFDEGDQLLESPQFEEVELEESTEESEKEEEPVKPLSPRKHMSEVVQEVMAEMKEAESALPAAGGLPVTTPKRSPSPRRPASPELGEESPPEMDETSDEEDAVSPETRKFKILEEQPELIDEAYGYRGEMLTPAEQRVPFASPRTPKRRSPVSKLDVERMAEMQYAQLADTPKRPAPAMQQAMTQLQQQKSPARPSPAQMVQKMPGATVEAQAEIIEKQEIIVQDPFGRLEDYVPPAGIKPRTHVSGWKSPEEYRTPPVQIQISPPTLSVEQMEHVDLIKDVHEEYGPPSPSSFIESEEDEQEEIVEEEETEAVLEEIVSPIKEILEQHEYTEGFFEPDRPGSQKFILTGSKKREIRRRAPAPAVSPIREDVEEFLQLPSPVKATTPPKAASPYRTPSPKAPSPRKSSPRRIATPVREEEKRVMDYYIPPERRPFIEQMAAKVADVEGLHDIPYYVPYEEPAEDYVAFEEVPEKRTSPGLPDFGYVQDAAAESPPPEYEYYEASPPQRSPVIPHGISPDLTPPDEDYFDSIEPDIEIDIDAVQFDDGQIPADAEIIPVAAPVSPLRVAAEMIADIAMGLTPDHLVTSPASSPPPVQFSPDSPYDSPLFKWMDLIEAIYMQSVSPEAKEQFVAGRSRKGTRHIRRHSEPPQLSPVMDVSPDYAEEYLPFRKEVFKAPGKIERRPFQFQKGALRSAAKPGLETWPEHIEYDVSPRARRSPVQERPREKRRRVRKQLTKKRLDFDQDGGEARSPRQGIAEGAPLYPSPDRRMYENLPPLPAEPMPEDLMGAAQTISSETIIETTDIYEELPGQVGVPGVTPEVQIPGWRTPEKYKPQRTKSPDIDVVYRPDLQDESPEEFIAEKYSPLATELPAFGIDVSIESYEQAEYEPQPGPSRVRTPQRSARRSPAVRPSPFLTPSPRTPQGTPRQRTPVDVLKSVPMDVEQLDQIEIDALVSPRTPASPMGRPEAMQEMLEIVREGRFRAERKPTALYGYGEREPKVLQRKQQRPAFGDIGEDVAEPPDDRAYWPGPYVRTPSPKRPVLSPNRLDPNRQRSPLYANAPPISPRRGTPPNLPDYWLELAEVERVQIPKAPVFDSQSPERSPTGRKVRTTKMAARKLVFDQPAEGEAAAAPVSPRGKTPPKTPRERIEAKMADVQIELSPGPPLRPEPEIMLPISPGVGDLEAVEPDLATSPPEYVSPRRRTPSPRAPSPKAPSPRTPSPRSPRLPDSRSPVRMEVTPPEYESPVMVESPPLPTTPPSPPYITPPRVHPSPGSPNYSPGEFQRLVREHEYTLHQYDVLRKFLTNQMVVGGKKIPVRDKASRQPQLMPVYERGREGGTPPARSPPRIAEEQMIPISPPQQQAPPNIEQIQAEAERQYQALAEEVVAAISPHIPPEYEYILEEIAPAQRPIMDVYEREAAALPPPITDQGAIFVSPPRPGPEPQLPRVSPRGQEQYSPPHLYGSPTEEYVHSPESNLFAQPAEGDYGADEVDVLTVSPVQYESPQPSPERYPEYDQVPSPYLSYTPPLYEPPPPAGSPIDSPSFMGRIQEHEYTQGFFDPSRPEAVKMVKSGRRNLRLYQKYGPGDLEPVVELHEQPIVSPQRLTPAVYATAPPRSAERPVSPMFEAVRHEPLRPTHYVDVPPGMPPTPKRHPERARRVRRKVQPQGRRLDFEEAERGSPGSPAGSPRSPERPRIPISARKKLVFDEEGEGVLIHTGGDVGSPQRRPLSPRASPRRSPSPKTPQKRSPSPRPSPRATPSPRRPKSPSPSPLRRSPPGGGSPKGQGSPKSPRVEKTVTTHTTIEQIPGVTPEELNLEEQGQLSPWAAGLDKSYIEEDLKDFKWLD